jgi:hypothetical protein
MKIFPLSKRTHFFEEESACEKKMANKKAPTPTITGAGAGETLIHSLLGDPE